MKNDNFRKNSSKKVTWAEESMKESKSLNLSGIMKLEDLEDDTPYDHKQFFDRSNSNISNVSINNFDLSSNSTTDEFKKLREEHYRGEFNTSTDNLQSGDSFILD